MANQSPPWGDVDRSDALARVEDASQGAPTADFSMTLRLSIHNRPGMLGRIASAIGELEGDIRGVDLVEVTGDHLIRDLTINARDARHAGAIVARARQIEGIEVLSVSDRTFLMHLGGKIEIRSKIPIKNREDLAMAYTPGVARVCLAIHDDPSKAYQLTLKRNSVAVISDGSAVLGLGDIGPVAAMPVLEGKALLFKEFAGVDAFPICLATHDVDEIVRVVTAIAPGFGGINMEDIAAPRCFEIAERLRQALDIPVYDDDQDSTAIVVLAALLNALKIVRKSLEEARIVVAGAGAAGAATARLLLLEGARRIVVCDRAGTLYRGREERMNPMKRWLAGQTNSEGLRGGLREALAGADVFIGLAGPDLLTAEELRRMAPDAIFFAMANPRPEIAPEAAAPHVRVMATGRSDQPNQINSVLAFPGVFRGAFNCRARELNDAMRRAAAHAIAGVVSPAELQEDYIIPSVFDRHVVEVVAQDVARAAYRTGVARRVRRPTGSG
jgi:malate dehydrogenase (oxaloacetate-decarboxylating)